MILRKPYAFLIKNFKKIHLLLAGLMIYIAYKTNILVGFFNNYIAKGSTGTTGKLALSYINVYMYLVITFIIIIIVSILILMHQKNKPIIIYLFQVIFYVALFIVLFQVYNYLSVLEIYGLSPQILRVIRDIIFISYIIQLLFLLLVIVRGLGFNIKKFNFGADLAALEIEAADREEFEITIGLDPIDITRGVRRQRRELRYFIIENLFVLSFLSIITIIIATTVIILNVYVYNRVYQEQDVFRVNDFVAQVNKSYLTVTDQRGARINNPGKQFLVVELKMKNQSLRQQGLKLSDLVLFVDDVRYNPIIGRYKSFVDLGVGYLDQNIKYDEEHNYIVVYEIGSDILTNELKLRWTETQYYQAGGLVAKYKVVALNPESLYKNEVLATAQTKEGLTFPNSFLGDSTLVIKEQKIADSFDYLAQICILGTCREENRILILDIGEREKKTILALDVNFNLELNDSYIPVKDIGALIDNFAFLRYVVNGNKYSSVLKNKTPFNNRGVYHYFAVDQKTKDATTIDLVIRLRNKEYIYTIK